MEDEARKEMLAGFATLLMLWATPRCATCGHPLVWRDPAVWLYRAETHFEAARLLLAGVYPWAPE